MTTGLAAALISGCGPPGEARSAGPVPTASAPARLWPDRAPRPAAPGRPSPAVADTVPGIPEEPSGDIRKVSALDAVQAEVRAHPGARVGADGMYEETEKAVLECTAIGPGCPLREPQFYDVTGNGKDDMIVAVDTEGGIVLRAYTLDRGVLTRILSTYVDPLSIEVAGRDLIVRAPAGLDGYETRYVYSWDGPRRSMTVFSEEIRKIRPTPSPATP